MSAIKTRQPLPRPAGTPADPCSAGQPDQHRFEAILLFAAILVLYLASPIISSGDSRFVLPTAISIVSHGDANIDEYSHQFPEAAWVPKLHNGHYWNVYPIGVPLLVLPSVWVVDKLFTASGSDLEAYALKQNPLFLELLLASIITAGAVALLYIYMRRRLPPVQAIVLAGLLAFGTPVYSSASRGLWQHGPSLLCIAGALLLVERPNRWSRVLALGLIAGYSYSIRPSNLVLILGFAVLTWWYGGVRRLLPYAVGAVLGVAPLFAFHLATFGGWFSSYYQMTQGTSLLRFPVMPLIGTLFSPSRGMFIFSPFLLFALLRLWPSVLRRHPFSATDLVLGGLAIAWWAGTSYWPIWWGGGSYGPRLMSEVVPCLVILLIPVTGELILQNTLARRCLFASFVLFGVMSVAIHLRGSVDPAAGNGWCGTPVSVDAKPERVWDWSDPQFLRGLIR